MAATSSAFRTEARDEHLYNHIELFNRSSSTIDAPAANHCQNCRGQHPTENQIATGRRMFGDYRTEPSNEHLYSSPSTESQGANQTSQDDRRRQQPTGNSKTMGRRVASAMIAVLALAFLAMLASLIATNWVHAEKSGTKNGCQDCRILNDVKQQLKEVLENLHDTVAKIIDKVSSNQTEERRLLETKIEKQILVLKDSKDNQTKQFEQAIKNHTLELKQEIKISIENQSRERKFLVNEIKHLTSELEDLAARVNQTDEGPWFKMMKSPFGSDLKDNKLSRCFIVPSSGKLAAVKLVHAYGYVACNDTHVTFWWGCGGKNEDVTVEIKTATGKDASLPSKTFSTENGEHTDSLRIPGYSPLSSELVLSYPKPPQVIGRQRLCLSYSGATNAEKSFFDVYARIE